MNGAAGRRSSGWLRLLRVWPALLGAWAGCVSAQTINISPVRAVLSAADPVAVFTLRNDDPGRPTLIQARASAWTVDGSGDHYDPTRDLLVSPTVFRLEPGQAQVVRVSLRGKADPRSERLYRLFLQQLPDEADPARRSGNLRFLLTFSLPVVVAPSENPSPAANLVWRIARDPAGEYRLRVTNDGTAHRKIAGVTLPSPDGELTIVSALTYLLPGTERVWSFKPTAPLPPGPVSLTVRADDGTTSVVQAAPAE